MTGKIRVSSQAVELWGRFQWVVRVYFVQKFHFCGFFGHILSYCVIKVEIFNYSLQKYRKTDHTGAAQVVKLSSWVDTLPTMMTTKLEWSTSKLTQPTGFFFFLSSISLYANYVSLPTGYSTFAGTLSIFFLYLFLHHQTLIDCLLFISKGGCWNKSPVC